MEPNDLLIRTLTDEEAQAYGDLVKLNLPKVPLSDSRDMDWLFALWGSGNRLLHLGLLFSYVFFAFVAVIHPYTSCF